MIFDLFILFIKLYTLTLILDLIIVIFDEVELILTFLRRQTNKRAHFATIVPHYFIPFFKNEEIKIK